MAFIDHFETPEAEQARLATAPVGSKTHHLSTIPVNILVADLEGLVIQLPWDSDGTIVVVPTQIEPRGKGEGPREVPWRRYEGSYSCTVVYSTYPSYPVGGYKLSIGINELVRGTRLDIASLLVVPALASQD